MSDLSSTRRAALAALTWLGAMTGRKSIGDMMADADIARFTTDLVHRETVPHLTTKPSPEAVDDLLTNLTSGADSALLIKDLAVNGSETLPKDLLDPIRARIAAGEPTIRLSLGVAAWIRYASGIDENGKVMKIIDPMAERLHFLGQQARTNPDALGTAFLGLSEIFDDDLTNIAPFRQRVITYLGQLLHQGTEATLSTMVNGPDM